MSAVRKEGEDFVVEAEDLARAFGVEADEVIRSLREGVLTSRCEKGIGEHEGRYRLVFTWQGRELRLTLDRDGTILSRALFARLPARAGDDAGS